MHQEIKWFAFWETAFSQMNQDDRDNERIIVWKTQATHLLERWFLQ